jgi:NAD(P)-dependent dehydrogenase (short-subunit alcohol dehydrogenase family)
MGWIEPLPPCSLSTGLQKEETMAGLLEGKSALITGGGGGIGRATALIFAREGARLAIADADSGAAAETVAQVNNAGGQAIALSGDVTNSAAVKAMMDAVVSAYGRIDCAFNNAGIAGFQVDAGGKRTHEWADESFDRMVEVNLKGVWLCMKHELIRMLAQGGGVIVNTGSIAGLIGLPTSSAYVAAKHGVLGLTKTAALEYAQDHIRVNAVCPGYIETKMTEDTMRRRGQELMGRVPFGRMGKPEEIGEMVLFLCSERSSYISGACYNVDGGYMAI